MASSPSPRRKKSKKSASGSGLKLPGPPPATRGCSVPASSLSYAGDPGERHHVQDVNIAQLVLEAKAEEIVAARLCRVSREKRADSPD